MSCPYVDTTCAPQIAGDTESCPSCARFTKSCPRCTFSNRAFANYCRSCGAPLDTGRGDWLAYKGSAQRLGFNASRNAGPRKPFTPAPTPLKLRLGDECWSLLGYDRHLIAVSRRGTIEIADPHRHDAPRLRFQVSGPITCQPCIAGGILYVGSPGQIAAYSLGGLTFASPQFRQLWQTSLTGNPIHALTVVEKRLYATIATPDRRHHVVLLDLTSRAPAARAIHTGAHVSWIAGDPDGGEVIFLTDDHDQIALCVVSGDRVTALPLSLEEPADQPIAVAGGKVFAIFGRDRRLYQLDARSGAVEEVLQDDVQMFALTQDGGMWDRDGVNIHMSGIRFTLSNTEDTFAALDRAVRGSPVIVQRRAAVIGMTDGRVRIYDLNRPPAHDVWHIDAESRDATITALASFDRFIAAGNSRGVVEVLELQSQTAGG